MKKVVSLTNKISIEDIQLSKSFNGTEKHILIFLSLHAGYQEIENISVGTCISKNTVSKYIMSDKFRPLISISIILKNRVFMEVKEDDTIETDDITSTEDTEIYSYGSNISDRLATYNDIPKELIEDLTTTTDDDFQCVDYSTIQNMEIPMSKIDDLFSLYKGQSQPEIKYTAIETEQQIEPIVSNNIEETPAYFAPKTTAPPKKDIYAKQPSKEPEYQSVTQRVMTEQQKIDMNREESIKEFEKMFA